MSVAPLPCLLVNPLSFRASRRGLAGRAGQLARDAGLTVHEVTDATTLFARLDALRGERVQQIWILSGDGILQALAEYLAERAPGWSPLLLLLGGGRANIVPRDVGGYPAMRGLRRALAALRKDRPLREEIIHTLRVAQPGAAARYGYLWAGALVFEGVRLTAAHRAQGRGWWRHSWFSDPWVLLQWAFRTMILRQPVPRYTQIGVTLPGIGELSGSMRVLIASSLQMRHALYDPFAERGSGPVRFTAVGSQARSLWRCLPAILRGRFDEDMDVAHGFLSGRADQVTLRGIAGYALDGELFTADPALPLTLSAGRTLRVLNPGV